MTLKPSLAYHFYSSMWKGLDLLFPPSCGGCEKIGERWCEHCQKNSLPLPASVCDICGEPQKTADTCTKCKASRPPYKALRSWVVFKDPIRAALHKLKYRRDIGLGEALALPLAHYVQSLNWDVEAIVPIPLSAERFAERGYNQVALMARPLAMIQRWHYAPGALQRIKHTRSQVGLTPNERRENVQNAFRAKAHLIRNKKILLMDDVATTRATLTSASRELVEAGASHVYVLTAARAISEQKLAIA